MIILFFSFSLLKCPFLFVLNGSMNDQLVQPHNFTKLNLD